jgi:hypothetical protein
MRFFAYLTEVPRAIRSHKKILPVCQSNTSGATT